MWKRCVACEYYTLYISQVTYFHVVTCQSLPNPMNGMISCYPENDGVLSYEDTCIATCDTGYMLTGDAMRTCQSDGMFNGTEAMCNRGELHVDFN